MKQSGLLGIQHREDLRVLRKPIQFFLAEDEISIHTHLEYAASAFDEPGGDPVLLFYFGRQTGGLGCVVSLHAVFDTDFHDRLSPILRVGSQGASWSFMVRIQERVYQ